MSETSFAWIPLLDIAPPKGCSLRTALFTTYDRPDERLLVEHLFPSLLALQREADTESVDRQFFLLELDQRLRELHNRVFVVSSTSRDEPTDVEGGESSEYRWIWHSVRHLTVGYNRKAVQHAKLWVLHWGSADGTSEYLELVVSSSNLTLAAFKAQIQVAWRVRVPVHPLPSEQRYRGWGVLPAFMEELAASTGDRRWSAVFLDLLMRATCPEGVTFIASVPGKHSLQGQRRTAWGVAGLRKAMPPGSASLSTSVLAPFIGSWNQASLADWCYVFGASPTRLALVWIHKDHPWSRFWVLPRSTLRTFGKAGTSLLRLRHGLRRNAPDDIDRFHDDHQAGDDPRWSHAKVYWFKRARSHRLLVTSANFSQAAWGAVTRDGNLLIENFELGVCVDDVSWPFLTLDAFDDPNDAATVPVLLARRSAVISWAKAVWNGITVQVDCRCDNKCTLVATVKGQGKKDLRVTKWRRRKGGMFSSVRIPWKDNRRPPTAVVLNCGDQTLIVPIFDDRPIEQRSLTVPPDIDPDSVQHMRDALLFERYGGRAATERDGRVDVLSDGVKASSERSPDDDDVVVDSTPSTADDYSVPAFSEARSHFSVIDNWAEHVQRLATAKTGSFDCHVLRRDGQMLVEAFERQGSLEATTGRSSNLGARLAAVEMRLRLRHFPET